MEQRNNAPQLLDLMARPAFCVSGGVITRVNAQAAAFGFAAGDPVAPLLLTGTEEYAALTDGCLYLTLSAREQPLGASVTRLAEFDVFCLEELADSRELQAMALAAEKLRQPLGTVMLTAQRIFPVSAAEEDPALADAVSRINRGLLQILRVVNNMSDAGHYAASPTRLRTLDIAAELDEIFAKAAALVEQSGVTLRYRGCPEAVYCLTDQESLERAVLNMISNALKFSRNGSAIEAALTRRGKLLYLTLRDQGSGIPEALQGDVFSRYRRQGGIEDPRFGIGLGMVLIRAAAAAHGGTVLVDHPDGCGTRITMTLAIRQGSPQLRSAFSPPDYAGERDRGLLELSQVLPPSLYEKEL